MSLHRVALLLAFLVASLALVAPTGAHPVTTQCRGSSWFTSLDNGPIQSTGAWQQDYWAQFKASDPNTWTSGMTGVPVPSQASLDCSSTACYGNLAACYPMPCFEDTSGQSCGSSGHNEIGPVPYCWQACVPHDVDQAVNGPVEVVTTGVSNVWGCVAVRCIL